MSAHVLLPLAVNSKSERKVDSLPPLGLEPVTLGTVAHLSNRSAQSHLPKSAGCVAAPAVQSAALKQQQGMDFVHG
jgi:hypothetical protein